MFLGVDSSCYTTSLAVTDGRGNILQDERKILPVPPGQQGLQQSRAFFYHTRNYPELMEKVFSISKGLELQAVAVSSKPRPLEGSYMPVFTAGSALARNIAALLGIPLLETTHQEGHLAAGLWSAGVLELEKFLALHLSGGTTELLLAEQTEKKPLRFSIKVLGEAYDISAGQLVDRVGVAMGLPFPAGLALERQAQKCAADAKVIIPSFVKGYRMSFSGAETLAKSYLQKGIAADKVARGIEHCIAATIEKVTRRAIEETGIRDVLAVGGVAANGYIRRRLIRGLEHRAVGGKIHFPQVEYCSDNAVGVSLIARSIIL